MSASNLPKHRQKMSENSYSTRLSRRSVLKNGVRTSLAGGALLSGSVGSVSAQTESEKWSAKIICPIHEELFLPEGVTCDTPTSEDDHSLLLEDRPRIPFEEVSWPPGEVSYTILENTADSEGLDPGAFQAAGDAAAKAWNGHADTIELVKGGSDITVMFGSVPRGILAVATVTGHGNEIVASQIRLDVNNSWKAFEVESDCPGVHPPEAFDVQGVVAHEFGHALGLGHEPNSIEEEESTDRLLTMYPGTPPGWPAERSPETGDIGGIKSLYGKSQ